VKGKTVVFLTHNADWKKVVKPDQGHYCKKRNIHTLSELSDALQTKQYTFLQGANAGVKNKNKCGVAETNTNCMITHPYAYK
jgi:hypothetical protein